MHSVRLRITLIATVATALAVTLVAAVLLAQLQTALLDEIDDSITDQAIDYEANLSTFEQIAVERIPLDIETLFVVVGQDGELFDSNDAGVSGIEVVEALGLRDPFASGFVLSDLALTSPTETDGADSMRAVSIDLSILDADRPVFAVFARATMSVDRTTNGVRDLLLRAVPLLIAFVGALAWWLTGRALRPVDRMRSEVDEISSSDLSLRVSESPAHDEVGQLATTMNRMLTRLEEAQRSQDQFVSDAAHELRTPLASIAAQLDVDTAHPTSADRVLTATNVRAEVSRLQSLIDALLASARHQNSTVARPAVLVDLDDVAAAAVTRVARPATVSVDQRSIGAGAVRGDVAALSSLVDNLLANAYRHATERVAIAVGTDADGVWLTVDDDGAGIDPADRERVFDRFVRLDEARGKDSGGSGLGLALARDAAEQHGGTLVVLDSELGGARFALRLPEATPMH